MLIIIAYQVWAARGGEWLAFLEEISHLGDYLLRYELCFPKNTYLGKLAAVSKHP